MSSNNPSSDDPAEFGSLIARAREGDRSALGMLIEGHRKYLLVVANAELGRDLRAKVGASDVVQQSMLMAQQRFEQFQGGSQQEWQAWLKAILENDLRQTRRQFTAQKRSVTREVNRHEFAAVDRGLRDQHLTPSSEAVSREHSDMVVAAVATLSKEHQQVLELRNMEQMSFNQIGERMNRSEDASRKLWLRAIKALQSAVRETAPELLKEYQPPASQNGTQ